MTETREAPTPREAWPHRVGDYLGNAVCQNCDMPWPCPSQEWVDGIVAALDRVLRSLDYEWLPRSAKQEWDRARALLDPEPKP